MNLVESLIAHLKKMVGNEPIEAPEGLCGNCWGRQEYSGKFYDAVKHHNLNISGNDLEIGWINDYAQKHLSTIVLHKHEGEEVCSSCKIGYVESDK